MVSEVTPNGTPHAHAHGTTAANCKLPNIGALALEGDLMPSLLKTPSPKNRRARFRISIFPVNYGVTVTTVLRSNPCASIDEHVHLGMLINLEPESETCGVWRLGLNASENLEKVMLTGKGNEPSRDKVDRMVYYRIWTNCADNDTQFKSRRGC